MTMRGTLIEPETEERPATKPSADRWFALREEQASPLAAFWSNLKDFLTEKPIKNPGQRAVGLHSRKSLPE